MNPENELLTAAAVEATKEIVPDVYKDGLQPTVKELGKSLHTVAKLVNVALFPVSALVWGYEKISTHLESSLSKRFENTTAEDIITPDPIVAGPTIEALRFAGHQEDLRELFTNLLATSMHKETAKNAHPSFVEIIKQITPDEAKILKLLNHNSIIPIIDVQGILKSDRSKFASVLKDFSLLPYMANCDFPELGTSYIGNLHRLGLIEISYTYFAHDMNSYNELYNHPRIIKEKQMFERIDYILDIKKGGVKRTKFGGLFYESCVSEK